MEAAELERALAQLARLTARARRRLGDLVVEIENVRAGLDKVVGSLQGSPRLGESESRGAEGTAEPAPVQVEVVFK